MTSPSIPQGAFSQLESIVRDERSALLRLTRAARVASVVLPVCVVGAIGIAVLGGGRWIALPRVMPFVVWVAAIAAAMWAWRQRRHDDRGVTTTDAVAEAIEHEQRLRRGTIRVASEVANSGALGAYAAQHATRALSGTTLPRAPQKHGALRLRRSRALLFAAAGVASLAGAAVVWSDGAEALIDPLAP